MVEVKGNDVPIEKIHSALDEINFGDLENMKEEGRVKFNCIFHSNNQKEKKYEFN